MANRSERVMKRWRKKPNKAERQAALGLLEDAMGRAEQAIPAGSLIYTSDSPKVEVSHVKSALNPGAVCEAMSQREGPWYGTGSDEEREHAASLRPCGRCARGDVKAAAS